MKQVISSSFHFECVDTTTVHKLISDLANKNSSGPDGITAKLLKRLSCHIAVPLTITINQSMCMGIFLSKLKLAKVIPIYKKDDRHILDNYRPISLLSTMSKVFEKVVFHQVYDYFSSNNLFYENQYGFRKKHSTELAAIELVDRILGHLDQGNIPISVFLDLFKAFDTVETLYSTIPYTTIFYITR